jgi:hypothetical protein
VQAYSDNEFTAASKQNVFSPWSFLREAWHAWTSPRLGFTMRIAFPSNVATKRNQTDEALRESNLHYVSERL